MDDGPGARAESGGRVGEGSDKVYGGVLPDASLDLGQKRRATSVGSGLWAAARACKEVGSTSDENFSEAEDALMVMLLAGANPCRRNARGQLPIHFAESASATRILVDLGGMETINAVDIRGRTPLHYAARHGHDARAKELIRLGADTLLRDSQKNTPADTAKQYRKQGLYEILKWAARRQASGWRSWWRIAWRERDDARPSCFETMLNLLGGSGRKSASRYRARSTGRCLPAHMQRRWWSGPLPEAQMTCARR